ncbi:MAG: hypothetical protein NG747_09640 [Candidatus Brocadia sp.]|nr:hypothetical protein [Candidatus Brocadia sp.]
MPKYKHPAAESDINRLEHHGLDRCQDKKLHAFARGVATADLHKLGEGCVSGEGMKEARYPAKGRLKVHVHTTIRIFCIKK